MFAKSRGMPSISTCVPEAEPGKLDIKGSESGILFTSLLVTSDHDVIINFASNQSLTTSFKECLIKAHAVS